MSRTLQLPDEVTPFGEPAEFAQIAAGLQVLQ